MEKTNFIRVEGKAMIVARNGIKYKEDLEKAHTVLSNNEPTWADNGIPEKELATMAGGNHNAIVMTDIDMSIDAQAVTYDTDGSQFGFGITKFLNLGFAAATKDGRPFTDEEQQKLIRAGESHLEESAKNMGALYLILPPQNGHAETRIHHFEDSPAVTCEATREELVAAAAKHRERVLTELYGVFNPIPEE